MIMKNVSFTFQKEKLTDFLANPIQISTLVRADLVVGEAANSQHKKYIIEIPEGYRKKKEKS